MSFPAQEQVLFLALAGSQAHGTATPESDVDVRGVWRTSLPQRLSLFETAANYDGVPLPGAYAPALARRLPQGGTRTECAMTELGKFLRLCADANPNALEVLFADPKDWLQETPAWRKLYAARTLFLSKKAQRSFLGCGLAQLRRIRTHRTWLRAPPQAAPMRTAFGLPAAGRALSRDEANNLEHALATKLRAYVFDDIDMSAGSRNLLEGRLRGLYTDALQTPDEALHEERLRAVAAAALQLPAEVMQTLNAERRYATAMRHWGAYQTWLAQRNPARARLEAEHGYDTKHAAHLLRLLRMGKELLTEGRLQVRRPDAEELKAVRRGALAFEQLEAMTAALEQEMRAATQQCTLPDDVDAAAVDQLAVSLMLEEPGSG